MSFYRIYQYPLKHDCYKHIYFKRDRSYHKIAIANADEKNSLSAKSFENLCRARRMVRDYILCNPFDYFCTFTFNEEKIDRTNLKVCQKRLVELFKNYRQRYAPDFQYIIIPEFHQDGAIHFHGMVRGIRPQDFTVPDYIWRRNEVTKVLEYVPNTRRYIDWKYYSDKLGWFSCSSVKCYEACAMYVSKYITKDLIKLPRGQRIFFKSENLKKPELIFDSDDIPMPFTMGKGDYSDDFVFLHNSSSSYGLLPPWYGECCSDLNYDDADDLAVQAVIFAPVVGEQVRF